MIPDLLRGALCAAARAAIDAGEITACDLGAVSLDQGRGQGDFVTALPLRLAAATGRPAIEVAKILGAHLMTRSAVADTTTLPSGHLAVTLTWPVLRQSLDQIIRAGPAYGSSAVLAGASIEAVEAGTLGRALSLDQARAFVVGDTLGRIGQAAGADVRWLPPEPVVGVPGAEVAELLAQAGVGAARYSLLRVSTDTPLDPVRVIAGAGRQHPDNPAYAVRYAHARAASKLREAVDLGVDPGAPEGDPLAHPCERALLLGLTWLPTRVAEAARLRQPYVITRYLEELAESYHDFDEACPVLPSGDDPVSPIHPTRLRLTMATRVTIAAGLRLLAVPAPDRM